MCLEAGKLRVAILALDPGAPCMEYEPYDSCIISEGVFTMAHVAPNETITAITLNFGGLGEDGCIPGGEIQSIFSNLLLQLLM